AFSVLAFLFFVSALGILPSQARNKRQQAGGQDPNAQAQTASGKISAVEKSSFTINVSGGTESKGHELSNATNAPKTMTFQIDKNTTVDGQLQVGANADVTYRVDGGNNVAVSVHIS